MASNIYIDTNIFIDLLDSTRETHSNSFSYVKTNVAKGNMLYINSDSITNAFYILSKARRGQEMELIIFMKKIMQLFEVVAIENKEVLSAFDLCLDEAVGYKDYEDAMQYVCAKKIEADMIVTNDKKFVSLDIELQSTNI